MRAGFPLAAAAASLALATAAGAATVHNSAFITGVTNFNGFEGFGSKSSFVGAYTEGGITVDYVGTAIISSISVAGTPGAEGHFSWYPNGGGTGYTRIRLASAGAFSAIQFQAGSGFLPVGGQLQYQLLNHGVTVGTGVAGPLLGFRQGLSTYGFDGAVFDEVRLQAQGTAAAFNPAVFDAGVFDAISISTAAPAPEPVAWALLIAGFAATGAALRRQRRPLPN